MRSPKTRIIQCVPSKYCILCSRYNREMPNSTYPLTREGQQAFDTARRIAQTNKLSSVDSLMLLQALLQLKNSRVQVVLRALNVKVENLVARINATLKLEANQAIPVSGANQSVLARELEAGLNASLSEMQNDGQTTMDEFALLLGMLQTAESKAGQILAQYQVTVEQVREQVKIIRAMPAVKKPLFAMPKFLAKGMRQGISPIFISLVLFTVAMAAFLWFEVGNNPRAFLIAFIMGGWVISVALHEFGHAIVAYWGGDESVEDKGYLTLNPLKYSNPFLSIILPLLFLLMGGIGFPGGAVYINILALRKPSYRSLVSAAGPFANLLLVILLALPFDIIPYSLFFWRASEEFMMALGFLGFLQITSIIINLLPIPGLDGFGILEPFLPRDVVDASNFVRPFGFFILYFFVFIDSPISDFFWSSIWVVTELLSPNLAYYANEGLRLFINF